MRERRRGRELTFSWSGFAMLALSLGALQMMLDRGQERGLVRLARDHGRGGDRRPRRSTCSSSTCSPPRSRSCRRRLFQGPQLRRRLRHDGLRVVMVMLATSALLAPYLQNLAGYPVYTAGLGRCRRAASAHRVDVPRRALGMWVDQRKIMAIRPDHPGLGALHHEQLDARRHRR